ncbi:MAG: hypothetical protein JWM41_1376 [Gemmatimonadetes bacterium]|nr:hypothetical protein [Gemmatimonadota bacterium]
MRTPTLLCIATVAFRQSTGQAPRCFDELRGAGAMSAAQHSAVVRGEPALFTVDRPDYRWPQVCVYQFIAAAPEASVAVLTDYPLRPSYLPDVRESNVVPATSDSAVKRIAYVIHVIARMTEADTLREAVHSLAGQFAGGYRLDWHMINSTMASSVDGSATFIPWRNDATGVAGTLMIYDQSVEPSSRLASLPFIKGRGIDAVRNTARAIARQVESETSRQPSQLQRQIADLRRGLARTP